VSGISIADSNLPVVTITRLETGDDGTFGKLVYKDFSCFTGELPDRNNQTNISCIPKGSYKCTWAYWPAKKHFTYLLEKVNGRSGVCIHSANFMGLPHPPKNKQVNGCIALGEKLGVMDGQKAVLLSKSAVRRFETLMNQKDFILEIV